MILAAFIGSPLAAVEGKIGRGMGWNGVSVLVGKTLNVIVQYFITFIIKKKKSQSDNLYFFMMIGISRFLKYDLSYC